MNRSLRIACLLLTALSTAPLAGCALSVDGNKVTAETLVRYEGDQESASVAYTSGQGVRIVSANGAVDVRTGDVSEVQVTFSPFTMDKKDQRDRAVADIENRLELSAITSGDIVIKVAREQGASGYLGADIEVVLPAGFDGAFEVAQNNGGTDVDLGGAPARTTRVISDNGSIEIVNARGTLDVATDNGSVSVDVATWSADNGSVRTGNGDISFSVPGAVNGKMTADASGELTEQGIPVTWATVGEGNARSYTMGDGKGGQVDLVTEFGDIALVVK
jgi:hypothetical protein